MKLLRFSKLFESEDSCEENIKGMRERKVLSALNV